MDTVVFFLLTVASNVVGSVFFKLGASRLPPIGTVTIAEFIKMIFNKWFVIGIVGFAVSFPAYLLLLNRQKLSIVYPVLLAATFILITLVDVLWFKEDLRLIQFIGIIVIIIGIAMLAQS